MNLWPHQQRVIKENAPRSILAWEMRSGKSAAGAAWLMNQPGKAKVIVCPKQLKEDWTKMGTGAVVLSKEEFKKISKALFPDAILIDECHYFAAPLFIKGRSQLATAMYTLVKNNPDMHVILLSATPIRQNAWSLHTLLCYIGVYYPWKEWREEFFELTWLPFLTHPAWMPRKDWRIKIRKYLEKHCDIVSLKDIVKYLPPATEKIIKIKHPKPYKRPTDKLVNWNDEHRWEQEGKDKEILALGYRKLLIAVHYTEGIDRLYAVLSKEKPTFVLDGRTKDAATVKSEALASNECYLICQSSMLFGFDGYSFGALVFASMSHSCTHHTQALGRQRHLSHLRPIVNYYLIGGRWDQRIFDCVMQGRDFNPAYYRDI